MGSNGGDSSGLRRGAGRARSAFQRYLNSVRRIPLLTSSGEHRVAVRSRRGNEDAWKELVRSNLRLVIKIAREYRPSGDIEDLISEGNLGLMEAARRFDPSRGVRFAHYAAWWIRKYILAALGRARMEASMPTPVDRAHVPQDASPNALRSAGRGRPNLLHLWQRIVSFDEFPCEDDDRPILETMPDPEAAAPEDRICEEEIRRELHRVLDLLSEKERLILTARYGLDGKPPRSLQQVGDALGCTREWARQLERRAIRRARRILEAHDVRL